MFSLIEAPYYYAKHGYRPIALQPGCDIPLVDNWQSQSLTELWTDAPLDANIGLQLGGRKRLAVIACEDQETFENVQRHLSRITWGDIKFPVVRTPSGDRYQIFIALNIFVEGNKYTLNPDVGNGELICTRDSYVVTHPSIIGSNAYELLEGDFNRLYVLNLKDIQPILDNPNSIIPKIPQHRFLDGYPQEFHTLTPPISRKRRVFYPNVEFALKWMLNQLESGHYREDLSTNMELRVIELARAWALMTYWRGYSGPWDVKVFRAHVYTALDAGQLTYDASLGGLLTKAGVSPKAVISRTSWLIHAGLIELATPPLYLLPPANTYTIKFAKDAMEMYRLYQKRGLGDD